MSRADVAARRPNPGRTLLIFFFVTGLLFGLVALGDAWKPKLGLDLQGGTRITLVAKGDVSTENLSQARGIIEDRVNGSGVAEAEVSTQGNQYIVVEIPGESRRDLVETVKRQAQLRFRVVAAVAQGVAGATPTGPGTVPGGPVPQPVLPNASVTPKPSKSGTPSQPAGTPSGSNRAPYAWAQMDKHRDKDKTPSPNPTPSPEAPAPEAPAPLPAPAEEASIDDPLTWMDNPDAASLAAFEKFSCPGPGEPVIVDDDPDKPLVTCDEQGSKLLLSKAMLEGTDLSGADVLPPNAQNVQWAVNLDFDDDGTETFAEISEALLNTQKQFAIVLDGQVISAPTMNGLITDGNAQIDGDFTESEARGLATGLKFGALPISFEKDPPVELVGPSLAGNQLSAGITAGVAGLLLVMLYCLFYYRGLGVVVIASLLVAAALTYTLVVLLSASKGVGFTLSLPGIAGLIVAVGITADSFIVFFERIRDEMRDGRSVPTAVEAGWRRARNTCLAADAVSLLAAVVLYVFAAGVVKGFAFTLGLVTVIDLVVFFWFTHPLVSWLARFKFFNRGHAMSGLSPATLGLTRIAPVGGGS